MAAQFPDEKKLDNIADKLGLNCPICLELIRDPKCLPCLHSFCSACLEEYTRKVSQDGKLHGAICCPTCRKSCPVSTEITVEEWITRMPTNYALQQILEYVSVNKGTGENDVKLCEPCKKLEKETPSAMFCKDCKQFQCEECVKIHGRFNMDWHKIVTFDKLTKDELLIMAYGNLDICDEDSKPLEFFCKEHAKFCCITCNISDHKNCVNVIRLAKTDVKDNASNTDKLQVQYVCFRDRLQYASRFFNENEKSIDAQIHALQTTLQSVRKSLNDKLDAFEEKALHEADQVKKEHSGKYQISRDRCDKVLAALNGNVAILGAVMRQGTPSQAFIATHKLREQLVEYKQDVRKELYNLKSVTIELKLGGHIERVLDEANELGALLTETTPHIQTTPHTVDPLLLDYKPAKLELMVAKDLKARRDGFIEEPLLTGLTYLSDGRLVAVDNKNKKCVLFDDALNLLGSCQLDTYPYSVIVDTDDTLMVTRGNQITKLRVNQNSTFTHVTTLKTTSKTFSISSMDDDNFVVGCYDEDKPVRVVSRSGVMTDLELELPTGKFGVDETRCCFRKELNLLVLTVRDQDAVYIFHVGSYHRHEHIKKPCAVVIDKTGCSFVCSSGTNSVVQISPAGKVIGTFKLDSMELPYYIGISEDSKRLIVFNARTGARKLHVYELL